MPAYLVLGLRPTGQAQSSAGHMLKRPRGLMTPAPAFTTHSRPTPDCGFFGSRGLNFTLLALGNCQGWR